MAQLDRIAQAAFKKLFGLSSTEVKTFPLGNESDPTSITTIGRDIFAEAIPTTAGATAGRIVDCTNATNDNATSRLLLTVNPAEGAAEGVAYYVTIPPTSPTPHGLVGLINPYTGVAFAAGDRVRTIIPKKFGDTWRPIVYATLTEIPPLDSSDWFLDERGGVVFFGTAPGSTPTRLSCYVYVGKTLAGPLDVKIGGTGADLSATGGAGPPVQYVKQAGVGAVLTVGTIAAADLPSLSGTYQPLDQDLTDLAGIARTRGDLIYGGASAWVDRAISATVGTFLRSDGTDPQWSALVLPNAITSGAILYGSSANVAATSAALAANGIVYGGGAGVAPATTAAGTTGTVLHGNTGSAPTFSAVSLTADVSGDLPFANLVQASAASRLVGRGSASGAGDFQEVTLGSGLTMTGTVLSSSGGAAVADSTATIGLTRVTGAAATAMRSSDAPPLDQGIAPIWTGNHQFGFTDGIGGTIGTAKIWAESLPTLSFQQATSSRIGSLRMSTLTVNRVWSLPDKTGTVAMTSDVIGTGADPATSGTISVVNRLTQGAAITPAVIFANAVGAGMYEIFAELACTTAGTGTIQLLLNWTGRGGAKANIPVTAAMGLTATTIVATQVFTLYLASGNITWTTAGTPAGGAQYALTMRGKYLGA